ncbi:hypothetical protein OIU77_007204 [Salix suchowensis]|uniref:PORR domain-containing protein n=1 Tax=Salix suchowensis TaxID=1278906 RepID=A0ABQ9AHL9_9ROSI|nr:hypothetical protein OIU77_007204 [Salix suchowensis]
MSQSTSIPKKQLRVRDHGFDNYMEIEKKMRKVLKFQSLILFQYNQTLPISRLDNLAGRLGFKQFEAGAFILKFPHVFEVYEHPVQRVLYCRLTRKAINQIMQEKEALLAQIPDAVTRLRKLIMMSNEGRLRLEHVRIARYEFGLPDDFEYSVVLKYPQFFRLVDAIETRNKYIEVVDRDRKLMVCAIEKVREREYREKGMDAEDVRFKFSDISGYDLRSIEAQKRMEKRAVASIHELLSLTVEKKMTMERIAHFRMAMNLPNKLKGFLLQHQGIFYVSTRGNHGKLHTVFLREAYWKGELVEPNGLYLARRKLCELVLLSSRKANVDRGLVRYRRDIEEDEMEHFRRDCAEDGFEGGKEGKEGEREDDLSCDVCSDFTDDDDDDVDDIEKAENAQLNG